MQEYRNIYQIARESTGITQERAAELIDISVESMRAYESGRRVPPDKVVIRMIEIYNAQYLAYQHLKQSDEVAKAYLPDLNVCSLSEAVLTLLKELSEFIECRENLISITCDGIITAEERPRFDAIMKELGDVVQAYYAMKFVK